MRVLSLFDGMACGMLALQKAGISVENYDAYEIDKYAVQTATYNFPKIKEHGNVFDADFKKYKNVDLLIGGSPCTYWSIAQRSNRETEASGIGWELFSQYVRAVKEASPRFFIYENNKSMSNAIRKSITKTFGFEPICINSALVSAQNRQRLYWLGKRKPDGTYCKVSVEQPIDHGILLKDILDGFTDRYKGRTVIGSIGRTTTREYFAKSQGNMVFEPVGVAQRGRYIHKNSRPKECESSTEQYYEARTDSKSNCITTVQKDSMVAEPINITSGGKAQTLKAQYSRNGTTNFFRYSSTFGATRIAEPVRVGALPRPNGELSASQGFRIYSTCGKSVGLKGNAGGAGGKTGLYAIPIEFKNGIPQKAVSYADGKIYPVYEVKGNVIAIRDKEYPIKLPNGYYIIRKLTVSECKRLQTVPEWYEFPVSDTQAYKMLGNGWTIDVIKHLLEAVVKSSKSESDTELYVCDDGQFSFI